MQILARLRGFPSPPPAAAFVVGCLALQQWSVLPSAPLILGVAVGCIVGALLWRRAAWGGWLIAAIIGFCWAAWLATAALQSRIPPSLEGRDLLLEGYVDELPLRSSQGLRFGFHVTGCAQPEPDCPIGRRIRLGWSSSFSRGAALNDETSPPVALAPGERWQLHVRLKRPAAAVNPGLFDAELRMLQEGVAALGYVRKPRGGEPPNQRLEGWHLNLRTLFEAARAAGLAALDGALRAERVDASGVLLALAYGDQAAISASDWDVFNRTGVAHLMSISGLHITMLAAIAGGLARRILHRRWVARSGLLLRVPAQRLQWCFAIAVAFLYSGLAGWGIPAQRTCWMLAVAGWALASGRSRSLPRILSLAAAVVCVFDPWAPLAAGFWLSFAAVAAIVLHASVVHASPPRAASARLTTIRRAVREAVQSQWAATLSLLPLGALFFSTLSLIGPLANAWAVPLVSGLVTPAVLLLSALAVTMPGVAEGLAPVIAVPTGWMLDALRVMASWPGGAVVLARPDPLSLVLAAVSVAVLLAPRPVPARALWALGLLPLFARGPEPVPASGFRLSALDIGQGMAVLVEAGGKRLLYDTGPGWEAGADSGARVVVPWLRSRGISSLDVLVISHADIDHSGGVASVLRLTGAERVFSSVPQGHRLIAGVSQHEPCRRGDAWQWGKVRFEFLHPGPEFPPGAARSPTNALSCVLKIESPAGSALLAGDIEARQEIDLVERLGTRLKSDLLLAPHHGSNTSSSPRFLAAVSPNLAIFQVGYRNRFRHPTPRVLGRYQDAGVEILRTDHHGALTVQASQAGDPWRIERARDTPARYWRVRTGESN